ncbi:MAG: hypothetical protein EXR75_10660 [Myxococcales bacterium]|nr:hypothetical protein [Myxococcales bacterium]
MQRVQPTPVSARAELDVPGETSRQARVFAYWFVSLLLAVVLAATMTRSVPEAERGTERHREFDEHTHAQRVKIALIFGLAVPGALTLLETYRRRRGGPHARGITVEVTADGELRLWGRGYGQRVVLAGADVTERLLDVYCGRLGSWRERRLCVRASRLRVEQAPLIEVGAMAAHEDELLGLTLIGGEGDCVEVSRADYLVILAAVRSAADAHADATDDATDDATEHATDHATDEPQA